MSSLFIDRRDIQLEHDSGALIIRANGQRIATVPLAPITRVFMRGSVQLSASTLAQLGNRGIGVVILSGRKGLPTLLFGRPHNDAQRRIEQIRCSLDSRFCLDYARHLVREKIHQQHQWFDDLRLQYPAQRLALTRAMRQMQASAEKTGHTSDLDSLRGLEGAAASAYFAGLRAVVPASLGFKERNRRPPRDPFNSLLSLTYTLAHAETALALHSAGFDPCVGYFHQITHSRESLACDLVEPIRPLVDSFCLRLVRQQTLTAAHFTHTASGCLLGKAGRARFYTDYEQNAPILRRAIRQHIRQLAARINPADTIEEPTRPRYSNNNNNDSNDNANTNGTSAYAHYSPEADE